MIKVATPPAANQLAPSRRRKAIADTAPSSRGQAITRCRSQNSSTNGASTNVGTTATDVGDFTTLLLDINPTYGQAILDGLRAAASQPGGTSYPVFGNFKIPVAGKTGTAQKGAGRADQSWYVGLAPYPNPRYVVVATLEHGGFGVETAAPAVRRIMSVLFGMKDTGPARGSTAGVNPFG